MAKNDFKFISYKDKVKKELDETAERGMTKVLMIIKAAAKSGAPVETGQLRDRIDYQLKAVGGKVVGIVGSPEQYAIYVEFGTGEFAENGSGRKGGWFFEGPDGEWHYTRGQKPQKFLRNAFRQNKEKVIEILGKEYGATFKGG
ncbi:HK97 gp10 family phage protein [Enterococcus faecalis]|nr:HK97 gp10 family phage protein [Enterococcus faecalis]NSR85317.1 HK97 gp10 family phage protein [Enterococcus faecalis]